LAVDSRTVFLSCTVYSQEFRLAMVGILASWAQRYEKLVPGCCSFRGDLF
jgi:hypothetical protein